MKNLTFKFQNLFLVPFKEIKLRILLLFVGLLTVFYCKGQGVSTNTFVVIPTSQELCSTSSKNQIKIILLTSASVSLVYNLTLNTQIQVGSVPPSNLLTLNPTPDCFAGGGAPVRSF